MPDFSRITRPKNATAVLLLNNGQYFWGYGIGAQTSKIGEICFNTSMTGYQEVLTDPSYAGQIINFTFPHVGNVGTNDEDLETHKAAAQGLIIREPITNPSNWRSTKHFDEWLKDNNLCGITGIDTRELTQDIRDNGAPNGIIAVNYNGEFDLDALYKQLTEWKGLEGNDLAITVTCPTTYEWTQGLWSRVEGASVKKEITNKHVVAIDYGAKHNILRCLADTGAKVTVVPANTPANDILALKPDGVFLSNGPGDPAATGKYAVPTIQTLIENDIPIFGICLGHQLLALSLGATTRKMHLGHRGANHPVKNHLNGMVEITSQNHGFEVVEDSLPEGVKATHNSLFDGSNEGLMVTGKPIFSVQYHPEASPGPQDSHYLFHKFAEMLK